MMTGRTPRSGLIFLDTAHGKLPAPTTKNRKETQYERQSVVCVIESENTRWQGKQTRTVEYIDVFVSV